MLKLIVVLLPLAANLTGQMRPPEQQQQQSDMNASASTAPAKSQKHHAKATPAAAASSSAIPGIPAEAVKIDENTYRLEEKDASGKPVKVWLFRRNPFGVSKVDEKEAALNGTPLPPPEVPTKATDLGDSYRFERSTPFGSKVWTRKKSELTDEERAIAAKSGTVTGAGTAAAASASAKKVTN